MLKSALLVLCSCSLIGYGTTADSLPLYPPQTGTRDAAWKAFFQKIHYPFIAPRDRRFRIEQVVQGMGMRLNTAADVLAQLGPPDWRDEFAGHPPKDSPVEVWCYVHTLKRALEPHYQGKMLLITIENNPPRAVESMQNYGLQKVNQ